MKLRFEFLMGRAIFITFTLNISRTEIIQNKYKKHCVLESVDVLENGP